MNKSLIMQLSTSFDKLKDVDETRALGLLRVCYTGENRNRTYISKEAIIDAIPSMFNKPIVCHYDLDNDTIGGHDVVVATDKNGNMFFVNLTDGIGTIPESANYYFEEVEEDDGTVHEYFVTEAILWKRSPVYRKIANDGIEGQSMEILVREGGDIDGIYHIDKFIFTAFCLLGENVEPCFESASLQLFDLNGYREQFEALMSSMRKEFAQLEADLHSQHFLKGGEKLLDLSNEKREVLAQYHLRLNQIEGTMDELNAMSLEEFSALVEQTARKFDGEETETETETEAETETEPGEGGDPSGEGGNDTTESGEETNDNGSDEPGSGDNSGSGSDDSGSGADDNGDGDGTDGQDDGEGGEGSDDETDPEPEDDPDDDDIPYQPQPKREKFSLTGEQMKEQIYVALSSLGEITNDWGTTPAYVYVDYSFEDAEIFCWDVAAGWTLCGFTYTMNGDNVVIDVDSKKRKKFSIVDFDEGEQTSYSYAFECIAKAFKAELDSLREFKLATEKAKRDAEVNAVFAEFSDLDGIEAFEDLQVNNGTMTAEQVRHECYAIRGEHGIKKFSANTPKSNRIPIEQLNTSENEDAELYGGFYEEFPPTI